MHIEYTKHTILYITFITDEDVELRNVLLYSIKSIILITHININVKCVHIKNVFKIIY